MTIWGIKINDGAIGNCVNCGQRGVNGAKGGPKAGPGECVSPRLLALPDKSGSGDAKPSKGE